MARFYGYFAAAYGTIWFVIMAFAVLTGSRVDAGALGFCGFPIISLLYALFRFSTFEDQTAEIARLQERVRELARMLDASIQD